MSEQLSRLPELLTAHVQLALLALLAGVLFSIPVGVLSTRVRWLERIVVGLASVIQTIPGLALLAIMVPLLAALHLPDVGFLPAIIALTLYSILPVLRNTVTGIRGVDPAYIEAARGVGMTHFQQLAKVELPLAAPVIVAGIRTATVWVVGIATLSTAVGAPSLGNYIFEGLQTRNFEAVVIGCLAAASLALVLDGLVHALEIGVQRRKKAATGLVVGVFVLLYGFTGFSLIGEAAGEGKGIITVGSKGFTEQYILSEILAQRISSKTDLPVQQMKSLGSTVAFDALQSGAIDVYIDYSGTIWATIMKRTRVPENRSDVLREVTTFLRTKHGIEVTGAFGFENAYVLAMPGDRARELGIGRISDLTPHAPRLSIGGDYEFFGRPEWSSIRTIYGLEFERKLSMDPSLMYQAASTGAVDVIGGYTTDGRIAAFGLVVLEDDRQAIPPYDAVILTSKALGRKHPEVIEVLQGLIGTIPDDRMRRMNLDVDQKGLDPADVARDFLAELGSSS